MMQIALSEACCKGSDGAAAQALWRSNHANVSTSSACEALCLADDGCSFFSHSRAYENCMLCSGCATIRLTRGSRYTSWKRRSTCIVRVTDDGDGTSDGKRLQQNWSGEGQWVRLDGKLSIRSEASSCAQEDRSYQEHCLSAGVLDRRIAVKTRGANACASRFYPGVSREEYEWIPAGRLTALPRLSSRTLFARMRVTAEPHAAQPDVSQLMVVGDSTSGQQLLALLCSLNGAVKQAESAGWTRALWWDRANNASGWTVRRRLRLPPTLASVVLPGGTLIQFVKSDFAVSARAALSHATKVAAAISASSATSAIKSSPTSAMASHQTTSPLRPEESRREESRRGDAVLPLPKPPAFALLDHDEVLPLRRGESQQRSDESWTARLRRGPASEHDVLVLNTGLHWAGAFSHAGSADGAGAGSGASHAGAQHTSASAHALRQAQQQHTASAQAAQHIGAKHAATNAAALVAYSAAVAAVTSFLATSDFRGRLYWRTNFSPGCGAVIQPNRSTLQPAAAPHGWGLLHRFDQAWASEATQQRLPRLRILNVSGLTSQRVDRHPGSAPSVFDDPDPASVHDCVHLTTPGPLDAWNDLLQDAMRRRGS